MVQAFNQISLYNKLTESLTETVGLSISTLKVMYRIDGEDREILLNDDFDGILTVNEFDSLWSPAENNLEISQKFSFQNPSVLYGEDGITLPRNKIGLAVHMHSKNSNFQKTMSLGTISNVDREVSIDFYYEFKAATLRGDIGLDFFLFLKEKKESNPKHASKVGMILSDGDIENLVIVVDGEGSSFPMSEFSDKSGPLWRLEKNWVEANIDTFDSSNVNLCLNIVHPLFEQAKAGKQAISRAFMGDIMVQAMTMIIQQVIIIENNSLDDISDALPDSILMAVAYWVSTFDIDTSSLFSITNSMKAYWDRQMINGGKSDD